MRALRFIARTAAALSLIAALAPLAAVAQHQTASIVFEVVDTDGNPMPGVAITLDGRNLQGFRFLETDVLGRARFALLPPGPYNAEFAAPGHVTIRVFRDLGLGASPVERITMTAGEMVEDVEVRATRPIDVTDTTTGATYGREEIQRMQIGSGSRSYQSVVQQAPGVAGGANPSVHGATLGENRFFLDGVDTTDPVTGTFGQNLNFDSIERIEFATGGFRAEHGLSTGGLINVVTRSGGNEFRGSFDIRYNDQGMRESSPHFRPRTPQKFNRWDLTLGGPIVKDKAWFFLAYSDILSQNRPSGANATRSFDGQFYLGKITISPNENHRIAFQFQADPADIEHENASVNVAAVAGNKQEQGSNFLAVSYWGRLTELWNVTAQLGSYGSELNAFPLIDSGLPALVNVQTGSLDRNYNDAQFSKRNRNQFGFTVERVTRSKRWHAVKFGGEYQDTSFRFRREQPGQATEYFLGTPDNIVRTDFLLCGVEGAGPGQCGENENKGNIRSLFVQDTWHVNRRAVLDYGLRWDATRFGRDDKTTVVDMSLLQPRFGVSFDLTGLGEQVMRFTLARKAHPGILTIPWAVNSRADATEIWLIEAVYNFDCDGDGVLSTDLEFCPGVPSGSIVAPNLKPTYQDEATLGYRHAFRDNMTLGATIVINDTRDIIEDYADTTLDPDQVVYVIDNIDELRRRYRGLEFDYSWRWRRGVLMANYTLSTAKGNVEYTQHLGSDWDYPVHRLNRFGNLSYDRLHALKVQGWFDLPKKFIISYNAFWRSGHAYNKLAPTGPYGQAFVDPRGSHRTPSLYQLDCEVRKAWDVGRTQLSVIGSILNLLHGNTVTAVNQNEAVHGRPTAYQLPRRYEVGFRFTF